MNSLIFTVALTFITLALANGRVARTPPNANLLAPKLPAPSIIFPQNGTDVDSEGYYIDMYEMKWSTVPGASKYILDLQRDDYPEKWEPHYCSIGLHVLDKPSCWIAVHHRGMGPPAHFKWAVTAVDAQGQGGDSTNAYFNVIDTKG